MPKNKRPVPRKSSNTPEDKDEAFTQSLCDLALDLVEQEDSDTKSEELRQKEIDFQRLIRKNLNQKKDEVLYDAIERAKYEDVEAYQFLRSNIEEAASTVVVRRVGAPAMEINAFVVPLFVHSTGGLKEEQGFQDQQAFEALVQSFQQAELESAKAKVVLINHAYDLAEIDNITYSHLNEMVRDAWASMTDKRISATPGLERSITGWSGAAFGAQDNAVELRFLLGFALKRADDPFYQVPSDEAAADAYFAARMARYQQWTGDVAELVKRCLAPAGTALQLNFLYQDLFHGGKEQGMAEYFMLQMMAEINQALETGKLEAGQVSAIVGPADINGNMLLRVNLYAADGALLASSEKPLDLAADLQVEVDDICDALATIGVSDLSVTLKFDGQGKPVEIQPYSLQ
ncbi:hypothetical protein [Janthinobacterium agaricidamnosum]|uniref:DUF2863 family protein n=1 Tax=Janthinobacterium agaricidamnosum NBRC 102515 = DSM 9628 TaxID=1349767 RepID=W0V1R4_9BURK|nr:hypothetical protein [Janthinobacterium agaricidamnosum]CDG81278.1 putative uncharacterized protein [Janthinobacterium agaricidamnosum NBRC 102515 = DSM 9628]